MSLYEEWLAAQDDLRIAKARELALRKEICDEILVEKLEGSKTVVADSFKVTATAKLNRSIDREVLETLWDDLTDLEKEAVVYKPSLVLPIYKKIEGSNSRLEEAITVKPGLSSLKIIPVEENEE